MMGPEIDILGVRILNCDFNELLVRIDTSLKDGKKQLVSYANANTLNIAFADSVFKEILNSNFTVHPDGVGVYIASAILDKKKKFKTRFTGSDFYPALAAWLIKNKNSVYFFGHTTGTLRKIASCYPELNICGYSAGFDFDSQSLIKSVNMLNPDLMIIGLGQPLQEKWISKYRDLLQARVIIAVGDGIKVFAGEKRRGPEFLQKLGLEWAWRLVSDPFKYWKRYILGNPLFLYRIFRSKYVKLKA